MAFDTQAFGTWLGDSANSLGGNPGYGPKAQGKLRNAVLRGRRSPG
jgi:hypothetical protein